MSKIRLGFVGVGGMGQAAHLRNYLTLPDCEVVALAEVRPKLGAAVAARYGIPKVYAGHRALLAAESLDGIVAIQQFTMHADLIPDLLEKGVPVLTEKPLADSVAAGEKILAAASEAKAPLYLAYHKRSDPATTYAKQQLDAWRANNEVGKLRYIRVAMPPGDWSAQGFSQLIHTDEKYELKPTAYSDPYIHFVNYYIHQINLIRFLLGEDYEVIAADPTGVTLPLLSDTHIAGTLEMSTHHTTLDWQEEAFISFERGWIKLELPAPLAIDRPGRVTVFRDPGKGEMPTTTTPTLPWIHAMRQQATHFLNAIRGEPTPLCTAADGLKDLQSAQQYIDLFTEAKRKFPLK
jgi:predicted dehydrogenase